MFVDGSTPVPLKRRRHTYVDPMEVESAKAKLAAAKEKFGREIRVFETSALSSSPTVVSSSDEPDDFYEFTAEDYYRILATKKEDKFLKTKKIREAEEAARKSKFTKAVIRVRFPDNHTLEVNFHPSETMQSLVDFLKRVLSQPDLPFYLCKVHLDYTPWIFSMQLTVDSENDAVSLTIGHFADTTPPKKIIKDMSQDFFSASFIPGAIVYFSYDLPKGDDVVAANSGPFLHEDVMSLKGLEVIAEQPDPVQSAPEPATVIPPPVTQDPTPAEKKSVKPKWLKM